MKLADDLGTTFTCRVRSETRHWERNSVNWGHPEWRKLSSEPEMVIGPDNGTTFVRESDSMFCGLERTFPGSMGWYARPRFAATRGKDERNKFCTRSPAHARKVAGICDIPLCCARMRNVLPRISAQ
eukprot:811549-Rhodomonas_salina.1